MKLGPVVLSWQGSLLETAPLVWNHSFTELLLWADTAEVHGKRDKVLALMALTLGTVVTALGAELYL